MVGSTIAGVIFGLVIVMLIGSLIVSAVLMPTLRLMIKDQSGFGYVFNTVLPAMIIGTLANAAIEFAMSKAQGVEIGQASGNWFNWPISLALLTYFINKRHEATVLQAFLAALITQVVLFVLTLIFVMVILGAIMATG
ncbi:MAG: hypothetical protein ACIAQF_11380 [Phycisphaerales bacterium JB065]